MVIRLIVLPIIRVIIFPEVTCRGVVSGGMSIIPKVTERVVVVAGIEGKAIVIVVLVVDSWITIDIFFAVIRSEGISIGRKGDSRTSVVSLVQRGQWSKGRHTLRVTKLW